MNKKRHHTVGWRFRGPDGAIYLCTRWVRQAGYDMRVVAHTSDADERTKEIGAVTNVSERAIGRTFHEMRERYEPAAHEQPCECSVCEGRE